MSVHFNASDPPDRKKMADKSGFLTKQGGTIKTWKERWCVLKNNKIYYSKSQDKEGEKGHIDLEGLKPADVRISDKKKCSFEIKTPARVFYMIASSDSERDEWIRCIAASVATAGDGNSKKKVGLQDFDLLNVIGKGAFGKVLQVRRKKDGKLFAMKILNKKNILESNELEHTRTEKNVLQKVCAEYSSPTNSSQVVHPFLVNLHCSFQSADKLYFVMDWVNGGELFHHLQKERRFSPERAKFYCAEIVLGLEYLHNHGIIYRDLKPENLLLTAEGHICMTDFGISKEGLISEDDKTTTFCGTPEYLAPEVLQGKPYNKNVDWWSFGTLMHEMLTGLPPFYAKDVQEMYKKIIHQELILPSTMDPDTKDIILKLLIRDPSKRLSDPKQIKAHKYFQGIDWDLLFRKEIKPSFVPSVSGAADVSQVDKETAFLSEDPNAEMATQGGGIPPEKQKKVFITNKHSMESIKRRFSRGSKKDLRAEETTTSSKSNLTGNSYEIPYDEVVPTTTTVETRTETIVEEAPVLSNVATAAPSLLNTEVLPVTTQPIQLQTVLKETVLREHIIPLQKEEIQPVIYREREQIEIHQITQQLKETVVAPTVVEEVQAEPEYRETVMVQHEVAREVMENSRTVLPATTVVEELAPIVEERVNRNIQEEIIHVIDRDIVQPTIIQIEQPIHERIREHLRTLESETEMITLPPVFGDRREAVIGNRSVISTTLLTKPMWEQPLVTAGERLVSVEAEIDRRILGRHLGVASYGVNTVRSGVIASNGPVTNQLSLTQTTTTYNGPPTIASIAAASILPNDVAVPAGKTGVSRNLYYHTPASTGTMYNPQQANNNAIYMPAPQFTYQPVFGTSNKEAGFQSHGHVAMSRPAPGTLYAPQNAQPSCYLPAPQIDFQPTFANTSGVAGQNLGYGVQAR
ncbi:hypothetical protein PROFUN_06419 [Planoprotostelium fungivorum]|uniref:Non-specific serine/threonine protein kinase n=1 Tax=Planoprotostelium fungivorum TaxID=1890364 RepID=A0A2P6NNU7_9EUKA|nr:hypothetical protein PROFUN_06419 [Planoprotostelium fungivorum]